MKAAKEESEKFMYANLKETNLEAWTHIREFFGVGDEFPFEYLYYQKTESEKNIVLLNPGLHMMMVSCKKKFKLNTVNLGLRMFQKNKETKSEGKYRLLQEGLAMLVTHLDDSRIVEASGSFFDRLAEKNDKKMTFDEIAAEFSDSLASRFKAISQGSAVLKFYNSVSVDANHVTIWIGRNSVMLMIGREEIKSFSLQVGKRD